MILRRRSWVDQIPLIATELFVLGLMPDGLDHTIRPCRKSLRGAAPSRLYYAVFQETGHYAFFSSIKAHRWPDHSIHSITICIDYCVKVGGFKSIVELIVLGHLEAPGVV